MTRHRNIRLLDVYSILSGGSFAIAVLIPYYRDQMGLSFRDFLLAESFFAATVLLLEVPTGWISDVWRRKHVLALGSFFMQLGYGLLLFGNSLIWAIAGQMVIGVGISLISGTNSAMLYDTLLSQGQQQRYSKYEGRRFGLGLYSLAAASALGGLLYPLYHQGPIALCVLFQGLAILCACRMDEPSRHKKKPEKHPLKDMLDTARFALHGHGEIGFIILFAAALFCGTKLIMWTQQPYYMAMGLNEAYFGILMAAGFILGGASSHAAHLLDGRVNGQITLVLAWALALAVSIGASLHLGWSGVALLMIGGSCIFGIATPRVSEVINHRIGSERRATILSTVQLMVSLMFIPVSALIGWLSDHYSITGALLGIAGWLCFAGIFLALYGFMRKSRR